MGLHEGGKAEQVVGLGQHLVDALLHDSRLHIHVDESGGKHQIIHVPRLTVCCCTSQGLAVPQTDCHGCCYGKYGSLAALALDGYDPFAAFDKNEGEVTRIYRRDKGGFSVFGIKQDGAFELFRGTCQLHDGLL